VKELLSTAARASVEPSIPIRVFVGDDDHTGWLTNQLKKRIHLVLPEF
jgi:hypothetical protein